MPTAVLTDRERIAVQAYLRLLHTVRAAFDVASGPPETARPPVVPPSVLAEAEQALARRGADGQRGGVLPAAEDWCPPDA